MKLLVDFIAQGTICEAYLGEYFADAARESTSFARSPEGSPFSMQQLNGSCVECTDSFHLNTGGIGNDGVRGPPASPHTQHLVVNLVLTLMKHVMHWAGSERVVVDPSLWESQVLRAGCCRRYSTEWECNREAASESCNWFAGRVKGFCNRAASVILDGVDREPSSWRCLIKHSQLVLKYSSITLEAILDREPQSQSSEDVEADSTADVDTLRDTIVGQLLPSVVTGLLPFTDNPVFARHLVGMVNEAVVLLEETCRLYPVARLADSNDGDRALSATKQKRQVCKIV